ncbi:hypothetical protein ACGFI9_20035 [Micromonospora sp. NPDC048930]|uniref:hypothetical protein n=1 Tax=Micromonospora sp. NPDC048930 TaxID=3364261 RepID=UPI0037123960
MSGMLDETLRAAVRDLADGVGSAPDLATRALNRGRRLRRRRRVAATSAVLVAIVGVTLPFALLRPDPAAPPATPTPTATPSPTMLATPGANWTRKPLVLPGGWVVTRAQVKGGSGNGFLLDRGRGSYIATDRYDGIFPAPTGSLVAVHDDDRPREVGLIDLTSGKTRWYQVDGALSVPHWSPDGRRLLLTTHRVDHFGFVVLDTDGAKQTHLVDRRVWFCTDFCDFTWTRDGREVALTLTGHKAPESSPRDRARGVQLFSVEDGRPTRFVSVPGGPAGPDAWSPDGKLVVVQGQEEPLLVETATGRVLNPLPSAEVVWVSDDRLLYRRPLGTGDFVLADPTGRELVRQPLPRELVDLEVTVAPR